MNKILYSVPDRTLYVYRDMRNGIALPRVEVLRTLIDDLTLRDAVDTYGTVRYSVKSFRTP